MFGIKRSPADAVFSDCVRFRDEGVCQNCERQYEWKSKRYHCSHFHSRAKRSVRFDLMNAVGLCFKCHEHFTAEDKFCGGPMNTKEHRALFEKRLGQKEFDLLAVRANTPQHDIDENLIRIGLKLELQKMREEREVLKTYR